MSEQTSRAIQSQYKIAWMLKHITYHLKQSNMANLDEAKKQLAELQETASIMQGMGKPIPASIQALIDKLLKQLSGNSSQQLADKFNDAFHKLFTSKAESNVKVREEFVKLIGEGNGLKFVTKEVDVEGTMVKIPFAEGRSTGGSKPGTGAGTDRKAPTKGKWTVSVTDTNPKQSDYAVKSAEYGSAIKVVEFILNNGKNPFDLSAATGKGSNMIVTLCGKSGQVYEGGISARENFKDWFEVTFEEGVTVAEPAKAEAATA
jgi:hypothetical protein